jgi:hypothetical protein
MSLQVRGQALHQLQLLLVGQAAARQRCHVYAGAYT